MTPGRSLFGHLLAWTLGALFVVWSAFVYFGYSTGAHEADELTDGHLASVASVLLSQSSKELRPAADVPKLGALAELKAHDYQQSLSIVTWDGSGKLLSHSGEAPIPRFSATEGFETIVLGAPSATWRTFSRWDGAAHERKVTVMLSTRERDELAQDIAEQVATPGLWLLPVVTLVLVLAVRRGLRPLLDLSHQVNQLDVHRDANLKAPSHKEFQAIVQSIDKLIGRYNAALARERDLASEVAHELRTPLTSLQLHAASLRHDLSPVEFESVRKHMVADTERAASVLTNLLALARAGRVELAESREAVDLADLARRVAAEFGQAALNTQHEISVDAPDACPMKGHPVIIEIALRNLIENALAHTPTGTTIKVAVRCAPATLKVIDNGAAVDNLTAVGTRSTHLGLGLGHQVVRRVADIHDGYFESVNVPPSGERCYRLVLERDP